MLSDPYTCKFICSNILTLISISKLTDWVTIYLIHLRITFHHMVGRD